MTKQVLVIGDWFIDEYWFIARHQSEISSHTGPAHFRIVSDPGDAVRDLCGAGLVARVLYELRRYHWPDGNPPQSHPAKWGIKLSSFLPRHSDAAGAASEAGFQIDTILKDAITELGVGLDTQGLEELQSAVISSLAKDYELAGVGTWAAEDDKIIGHYIHGRCVNGGKSGAALCANFRLTPGACNHEVDIALHRLQPKESDKYIPEATIRIIRTYQFGKDKFKMINRVDWEPRLDVEREVLQSGIASSCREELTDWLRTIALRGGNSLEAVVLDDHLKGFSKRGMIERVVAEHSKAQWFVRTKDKEVLSDRPPPWYKKVNQCGYFTLLAVGPDIASRRFPLERLYTASTSRHLLTRRSYELLTSIRRCSKARNVVVASDLMELIILAEDGACYGARSPTSVEDADLKKINWTTAFFTCLAHQMLTNGWGGGKPSEISGKMGAAIEDAHDHCGVKVPESVYFRCKTVLEEKSKTAPQRVLTLGEWETLEDEWRQATTGLGTVERSDATGTYSCLQVWRAKTDLPGYIACIEQKRDAIGRIWQAIKSFKMRGSVERPLSILLEADPGVGKTFLAETLAKTIGCRLIHHDVTQMIHREELLDLFDSVATAQAEVEANVPVMVFVDEINATLDSSPVYGAFLSPLEGGFYMRRGTKFKLKPCIWMFAGTGGGAERGSAGGGSKHQDQGQFDEDNAEKLRDFMSRLDIHEEIGYGKTQQSICESCCASKSETYDPDRLLDLLARCFGLELEALPPSEVEAFRGDACRHTYEAATHPADASRSIPARFAQACQGLGREGILSRLKAPPPVFSTTDLNRVLESASVLQIWFMCRDRFLKAYAAHPLCALLQLDADARLEQVYLGAEMIHQRFADATSVSKDILEAFYAVDPHASDARNAPARKIRRLVLSLANVQYGRVGNHNCTASAWKELLKQKESMLQKTNDDEGDFAEIWANRNSEYIDLDFG